jgi:hypothetical protein
MPSFLGAPKQPPHRNLEPPCLRPPVAVQVPIDVGDGAALLVVEAEGQPPAFELDQHGIAGLGVTGILPDLGARRFAGCRLSCLCIQVLETSRQGQLVLHQSDEDQFRPEGNATQLWHDRGG